MQIITGNNIHKTYKNGIIDTHVLRGVDISVNEGEFVAIMGRSGAGKSTLLYQLSGLDRPSEGSIIIDGSDINHLTEVECAQFRLETLGFVFQDYALIPELSARENIMLPLLMRRIDWKTAERIADGALNSVGLGDKFENLPAQLSGGEQQRVAVARAIAGRPRILFADEPTANLDSVSGRALIDLLESLHREGQTIVMVTHEEEYTDGCDRIVFLSDGQIESERKLRASSESEPAHNEYVNPVYAALERRGKEAA